LFIPDPDPDFLPIPDPGIPDLGVKKVPDPGSLIPDPDKQHCLQADVSVEKRVSVNGVRIGKVTDQNNYKDTNP
jgi:hypothetical protein